MRFSAVPLTLTAVLLAAGCAVGPDFERPAAPSVKAYEPGDQNKSAETDTAPVAGGEAQKFVEGDIPAAWWELFKSEQLNALIAEALKANPDLDAAEAALRQAHENTEAENGALFPTVSAGANVSREKLSGMAFGSPTNPPAFTLYNASVNVSYAVDIFGLARRSIEQTSAQEEIQRFQLEAARISLTANVVTAAVTEASLRGQIAATQSVIDDEQKQLDLLQNQFDLGAVAKTVVLTEAATLAQTKATLPPLQKQLALVRHQLSALIGRFPSDEPSAQFQLSDLKLPQELPVTLPSQLVEQRPDVRAAEANMHAANAGVGIATANMLPQFPITGDIGSDAGKLTGLFASGTGIWTLTGGVTQPIFEGGTLLHERRAAEAGYDVAAAEYRKTVLAAFQNVADTLRALRTDAEALKAEAAAEQAAADSLRLAEEQYKDGAVSSLFLLTAELTDQQAKVALVQAEANRYADTAALFQALGGGWWNRPDLAGDIKQQADDVKSRQAQAVAQGQTSDQTSNNTANQPADIPAHNNGEQQ